MLNDVLSLVLIGKNKEDLEENQNFLDLFKTYPATLKNNIGNGLVYDRFNIMSKHLNGREYQI